AGHGAVPGLVALHVQVAELLVIAVAAERARQPGELPLGRAQTAAEVAILFQTAVLAQQRPAPAGRAITGLPANADPERRESVVDAGECGEQRQTKDSRGEPCVETEPFCASMDLLRSPG